MVLISGMEEKSSQAGAEGMTGRGPATFHSASLLTSVRLQFLAGCFGLGTCNGGLKGESVQLHHYQVISNLVYTGNLYTISNHIKFFVK